MEEVIVSLISSIKSQWLIGVIVIGWGAGKLFKPFFDLQLKNMEKKEDSELKSQESSFKLIETLVKNQIESNREMSRMVSEAISAGFDKVCNTLNVNFAQNHGDHTEIKSILSQHSEVLKEVLKEIKNKIGA